VKALFAKFLGGRVQQRAQGAAAALGLGHLVPSGSGSSLAILLSGFRLAHAFDLKRDSFFTIMPEHNTSASRYPWERTFDRPANCRPAPAAPAFVLAMLLVVYTFNFIDRQILGILAGPIKADLHLSDTQLGALGGFAFALLYSTMGLPLAWLATGAGRTPVIAASLAVWSAFTALCGLAGGYGDVRVPPGRGRGRGGGVAPSYALISDYFPPQRRAGAGDLFAGHSAGVGAGILLGGHIAAAVNWRAAFSVGLAGLVFTPLFALLVRDPAWPGRQARAAALPDVLRILAAKRSSGCSPLARPRLDDGLWAGLLAALADAPLLWAGAGGNLAFLRPAAADRRFGGRAGGRLGGRLAGPPQPRRLCDAACDSYTAGCRCLPRAVQRRAALLRCSCCRRRWSICGSGRC
jgi:MFS family permease